MQRRCLRALGFLSAIVLAAAMAEAAEPLAVNLTVARVVRAADGSETTTDAAGAKPGERLRYTAVYRNTTDRRLSGVVATVPVPPGTTLERESPRPAAAAYSVDGTAFRSWPAEAGKQPSATVVRAMRWAAVDLAPGASFTVTLTVQIDAVSPTAPAPAAPSHGLLH